MHAKPLTIVLSVVTAWATVALGAGFGQEARAATDAAYLPCGPAALVAGIAGAGSGATLSLAPHCTYELTAALPAVNQDLTIRGNGATIERSFSPGVPDFSILTVNQGNLVISDLSFRNGGSGEIGAPLAFGSAGGAIDNYGNLTVTGGDFTSSSTADGGAILNEFGNLSVRDAVFAGNAAVNGGAIENNGTMVVTNSTFTANTATSLGGAVATAGDATVSGGTFSGNTAESGGGMWSTITAAVTGSDFRGDKAGLGGGVFNDGFMTFTGGQLVSDTASYAGGGIYNDEFGEATVTGTAFLRNTALFGGGMDNEDIAALSGSPMYGNSAGQVGGGIYTDWVLTVADSQILRNVAAAGGGGIYNSSSFGPPGYVALSDSAVLDNRPDNCEGCQPDGAPRGLGARRARRVGRATIRRWPGGRPMPSFPAATPGRPGAPR
jgi:predicted outer membrane repeat protein